MNYATANKLLNQTILIQKKDSKELLFEITNVYRNGIAQERRGSYSKTLMFSEIKSWKSKNVRFLKTKDLFESMKQLDTISTHITENFFKNSYSKQIITRKKDIIVNGDVKLKKIKPKTFEMIVFKFFKKNSTMGLSEMCPLALINNEYLFAIYNTRFLLLDSQRKIVFADDLFEKVINFLFKKNQEIKDIRSKSLKHLAEDLL